VVEAADLLGSHLVAPGDVVLALASSGLHSNGFSLVRKIVSEAGWSYTDHRDDFGRELGLELLEPTMLYTSALVATLAAHPGAIHSMSHVTGGGIAQNLSRVLPQGVSLDVDRATWAPAPVFGVLAEAGGFATTDVEDTWNMGIGFCVVVASAEADAVASTLTQHGHTAWRVGATLQRHGHRAWRVGEIAATKGANPEGAITEAKGVSGGAVRLVGTYLSSDSSSRSAHLS
jgi:phosphoribosylformylglycinamidine cyclo-ligase